jgi:hypothetical protein
VNLHQLAKQLQCATNIAGPHKRIESVVWHPPIREQATSDKREAFMYGMLQHIDDVGWCLLPYAACTAN